MARDEFPKAVQEALAKRVGFRCSFPGCNRPTIGPSDEGETASSNTGMACHIAAASDGPSARRIIESLSKEERSAIENGIWMCYFHGKLIDTDETRFTIDMLKNWRKIAERRAQLAQELDRQLPISADLLVGIPLVKAVVDIQGIGEETARIGEALDDSCVPILWGEQVGHAVRDVVIELARNAFIHGNASTFTLNIEPDYVRLTDDGHDFDPWNLVEESTLMSGGRTAIRQMVHEFGNRLILATERVGKLNETTIAFPRSRQDVSNVTPCAVTIEREEAMNGYRRIEFVRTCRVFYVILPRYFSPSEGYELSKMLRNEMPKGTKLIWVVEDLSLWVKELLRKSIPGSEILELP
jgi:hypothetical protein